MCLPPSGLPKATEGAHLQTIESAIGRSLPRIDGRPKVTGRAQFAADITPAGLLHGRPVLAIPAHARIERIDVGEALAVPGVVAVLTAADLPIVTEGTDRIHQPLARSEILWAGQPVALVVADTFDDALADAGGSLALWQVVMTKSRRPQPECRFV